MKRGRLNRRDEVVVLDIGAALDRQLDALRAKWEQERDKAGRAGDRESVVFIQGKIAGVAEALRLVVGVFESVEKCD